MQFLIDCGLLDDIFVMAKSSTIKKWDYCAMFKKTIRVSSGFGQLDQLLGGLFIGDNVAWYDEAGNLASVFSFNFIQESQAQKKPPGLYYLRPVSQNHHRGAGPFCRKPIPDHPEERLILAGVSNNFANVRACLKRILPTKWASPRAQFHK